MGGDYGYFGKGTKGYVHYNQAFQRNFGKGGGGGARGGCGCGSALFLLALIVTLGFVVLLAACAGA